MTSPWAQCIWHRTRAGTLVRYRYRSAAVGRSFSIMAARALMGACHCDRTPILMTRGTPTHCGEHLSSEGGEHGYCVRYNSLLPVPSGISDQIAAQMLINTITASMLIKAGHNSLKSPITLPVYILQNAAASG